MEPAHTRNIGETRGVILWGSWSAYGLTAPVFFLSGQNRAGGLSLAHEC